MFFENFYETIGEFDQDIIQDFKKNLFNVDLTNPKLNRDEYCFRDGAKLILPLHFAEVRDVEYYKFVKPLIDKAYSLNHDCLKNTIPFRAEISIIEPNKQVLWHYDQHLFHKYSERIHFPIITNDDVDFVGKWFTDNKLYTFKMEAGKIYRFNNRSLHTVKNKDTTNFRCHVFIDFMKRPVYDFMVKKNKIENCANVVTIDPTDEIYYYINSNPTGVKPYEVTTSDVVQLKNLHNYALGSLPY